MPMLAPAAPVLPRPPQIRLALLLNLISLLLLGPLTLAMDFAQIRQSMAVADLSITTMGMYLAFVLAAMLGLLLLIDKGKNWARVTLAVLFLLGVLPVLLQLPENLARSAWLAATQLAQLLLQLACLWLLFGRPANAWFKHMAPQPAATKQTGADGKPVPQKRSQFITITAWLMIVLSLLCAFGAAAFALMIQVFIVNDPDMAHIVKQIIDGAFNDKTPPALTWVFEHAVPLLLAITLSFALQMLAGIGLLQRKNWGRIATIVFMLLGILITVAGGFGSHVMMEALFKLALKNMQGSELLLAQQGVKNMWLGDLTMTIVSLAPLVAIIWKLLAQDIRREFTGNPQSPAPALRQ